MNDNMDNIKSSLSFINLTEEEWDTILSSSNINTNHLLKDILGKIKKNYPSKYYESVITKFMEKQFKRNRDIQTIKNNFNKLEMFLEEEKIELSQNLLETILSIEEVQQTISFLIEKYKKQIQKGLLDSIIECQTLLNLIELYCDKNNIEIKEERKDSFLKEEKVELTGLSTYFKEISAIPVLKREEEIELAIRIKNGDEEARTKLIESNLKLVVSIASKYKNRGIPFQDLIEEGNIGLIKAVDLYDISYHTKFSTFATYLIRKEIMHSIYCDSRIIRIPVYQNQKLNQLRFIVSNYYVKYQKEPTIEELSQIMNMTKIQILELLRLDQSILSLNKKDGEDESFEIEFLIPEEENFEKKLEEKDLRRDIYRLIDLCHLTPIERDIIISRYGLDGKEILSLQQLANRHHVTKEWIRQIQLNAEKKIKYSNHIQLISVYRDLEDDYHIHEKQNVIKFNNSKLSLKIPSSLDEFLHKNKFSYRERIVLILSLGLDGNKALTTKEINEEIGISLNTIHSIQLRIFNKLNKLNNRTEKMSLSEKKTMSEEKLQIKIMKSLYDAFICTIEEQEEKDTHLDSLTKMNDKPSFFGDNSPLLDFFKLPSFTDIINCFDEKQATIFMLKVGYINNQYYDTKTIAKYLGISEVEVEIQFRQATMIYQKNISKILDKVIEKMQKYNKERNSKVKKKGEAYER